MKEILMSIHHKWAELIYSGEKTLELRKTAPKGFEKGELKVYLYETDLKSVTGVIYVNFCHKITEITPKIVENSCVSLDEIEKYKAHGKGKLYAWHIVEADYFGKDWLHLKDLGAKRAPQSWQFVR